MINLNYDISNIQQLDSIRQIAVEQTKAEEKPQKEQIQNDEAVKAEISENVNKDINEIISKEDILTQKFNSAKTIYDGLAEIRLQLGELMQILKSPEIVHIKESLDELDKQSNLLIDKAIRIVKDNDKFGLIDIKINSIYFDGLNSIKQLSIKDNSYLTKIDDILATVKSKQNAYSNIGDGLYNDLAKVSDSYEKLAENKNTTSSSVESSTALQKEIVNTATETLQAVCSKLTPETVMRLLS